MFCLKETRDDVFKIYSTNKKKHTKRKETRKRIIKLNLNFELSEVTFCDLCFSLAMLNSDEEFQLTINSMSRILNVLIRCKRITVLPGRSLFDFK